MTIILSAKPVVESLKAQFIERCTKLKQQSLTPTMKVILVGNYAPSLIYTKNKKKFVESIGGNCDIIHLEKDVSEDSFLKTISEINDDDSVHGCFVQLPLPDHLKHIEIEKLIYPHKDVDGFHKDNLDLLLRGDTGTRALLPCTPKGIINLLKFYSIDISGKSVVVIGRSMIVGRPMALLALNHNGTPTIAHSKSQDLKKLTKEADIIISAIGKPNFLTKNFIGTNKPIIIDVGINHDSEDKLCGDVDFENVKEFCHAITPVPGGIGPMTISSLVENLLTAAERTLK